MTHLVTEACIRCKYTDCVDVCPVDCFYEGASMLVIDPDECIDCGICIPECPIDAIITDENAAHDPTLVFWLALNQRYAKQWPRITKKKAPLPDAEHWKTVKDKYPSAF